MVKRPVLTGDKAKPTFSEIPTIDVSQIYSASLSERKDLAVKVGKACSEGGFQTNLLLRT